MSSIQLTKKPSTQFKHTQKVNTADKGIANTADKEAVYTADKRGIVHTADKGIVNTGDKGELSIQLTKELSTQLTKEDLSTCLTKVEVFIQLTKNCQHS